MRMAFRRILAVAVLFARIGFAQDSEEALRAAITAVRYSPLAEAARIQGDVHVTVDSGAVTSVSGHPLLTGNLPENAKIVASILGELDLDLTYHLLIRGDRLQTPLRSTTVKRGNAMERAFFRIFHLKTEKVVMYYGCEFVGPPNDFKIADRTIEIWIYGKEYCVQPEAATLAALVP